jgi:D-alanyl-D-alanine carboxypeptidase (penicillin-binding protein 5/6)
MSDRSTISDLLKPLALAFGLLVSTGAFAQTFTTIAPQAVLMDSETGAIVFEVDGDRLVAPASLVKIMTAEVVFNEIRQGRLKLEDEFTVSENAWRKGGAPSRGSSMFLSLNSKVKLYDLLVGLIVLSGNDAAIVIAEALGGNEANFALMMTKRAREIGLTKSTFMNAHGMPDPMQRATMREMARLSDHIIKTYPELYKIFGIREMTWNRIRQTNRNPLLAMEFGADGLKTGNIEESGFSLVGSAVQGGQRLIVAVSGLKTERDRQNEAKKILDWGFRSFEVKNLFSAGATVGDASVFGGSQGSVPLVTRKDVRLPVPRGNQDRVSAKIAYRGPLVAPVEAGVEVAKLQIFRGNLMVMETPLHTAEAVQVGTLRQRATDAALELSRTLIRDGFTRVTKKPEPAAPTQSQEPAR